MDLEVWDLIERRLNHHVTFALVHESSGLCVQTSAAQFMRLRSLTNDGVWRTLIISSLSLVFALSLALAFVAFAFAKPTHREAVKSRPPATNPYYFVAHELLNRSQQQHDR